jgi:enamine deaminase RidA (YjgF/YER057c/UK114 family)
MSRVNYSSSTKWEPIVGYSRAVRIGNQVFVSGTTATKSDGTIDGKGDPAIQTRRCIENIQSALNELGGNLKNVVRTRIFVVDMDHWEPIGRVHGEFFGSIRPATSMVEVSRLIGSDILVEIEADAVISDE